MRVNPRIILSAIVVFMVAIAQSDSTSLLIGSTGAPGEITCQHCHDDLPVNGGPGQYLLTTSSAYYTPGDTFSLYFQLSDSGLRHWCFTMTELDRHNRTAGVLISTDSIKFITFRSLESRFYVESTFKGGGNNIPDTSPTWKVEWLPDSLYGPVTFYSGAMGMNLDGEVTGDRVYTIAHKVFPSPTVCCTDDHGLIDGQPGIDMRDLIAVVDYLYGSMQPLVCASIADFNGDESVDLVDLTALMDHLLVSFEPLPTCQ